MARKLGVSSASGERSLSYVVYDKPTGRIVHTHIVTLVDGAPKQQAVSAAQILEGAGVVEEAKARLTNADLDQAAVLAVEFSDPAALIGKRVDPGTQTILDLPRLTITPAEAAIEGDGGATVELAIAVVDASDEPVGSYSGEVKVVTERGRLSARGGMVALENGKGSITLTSVAETVARVRIVVHATDGAAAPGTATVEFL